MDPSLRGDGTEHRCMATSGAKPMLGSLAARFVKERCRDSPEITVAVALNVPDRLIDEPVELTLVGVKPQGRQIRSLHVPMYCPSRKVTGPLPC